MDQANPEQRKIIRRTVDDCVGQIPPALAARLAQELTAKLAAALARRPEDCGPVYENAGWWDKLPKPERERYLYQFRLLAWKQCPKCGTSDDVSIHNRDPKDGIERVTLRCMSCRHSRTVQSPDWRRVVPRPGAKGKTKAKPKLNRTSSDSKNVVKSYTTTC